VKKFILIILAALTLFTCQKKESDPLAQQDVFFSAVQVDPGAGLKSTDDWDWQCQDLDPVYAKIKIGTTEANAKYYTPAVFRLDGKLYTQAIKLDPGTHTVYEFLVMDDMGNGIGDDDEIYMATPENGATFSEYSEPDVPFDITVTAFAKTEVDVEVLCFQDKYYLEFGFEWFAITEIVVREQCFFGDFCVEDPAEYLGSDYENQSTGLMIDMPAIFQIRAYKEGAPLPNSPFSNASVELGWGVGHVLCVQYPDNLNADQEVFTFELWVYVKIGSGFGFKHFHTWTFMDEEMIEAGDDGVVDFVLGNCNFTEPDLLLPPYQNLPPLAILDLGFPATPGYWSIYVDDVNPAGQYDLPTDETLSGWCGDFNHQMGPGTHTVNVFSSLNSSEWPNGIPIIPEQIAMVNWLFNNLDSYAIEFDGMTDAEGDVIQSALWKVLSGVPTSGLALQMANDAFTHGDYVPLPGDMAAVLFMKTNLPLSFQLSFTILEPL
jgi:hypothetical protein